MTDSSMTELLGLRGRTALVTGGSRGVGRATALLLARAGVDVGIAYRSRSDEADRVVGEITGHGVRGFAHGGDLSRPEVVAGFFDEAMARFGGVDFVIGNHGIWPAEDVSIGDMSEARWRRTLEVNLDSIFHLCQAAARHLRDDGRLVLVSSTAGQRGVNGAAQSIEIPVHSPARGRVR